jgi:hypothetical protein
MDAMKLPIELIVEIAGYNGVVFAKLCGCSKGLQKELPKYIDFARMCRVRMEWDGILIECEERHYPLVLYDKIKPNLYNNAENVFHDDIRYKLYKNKECVLIIHILLNLVTYNHTQIHVIKRINGAMKVVKCELKVFDAETSEFCTAAELMDEYAEIMYGSKMGWRLFRGPKGEYY